MRRVGPLLALIFLAGLPRPAESQDSSVLSLSLEQMSQRYCQGDADVGVMLVSARFRYSNRSGATVMVLRQPHSIDYVKFRPEHAAPSEKPEYTMSLTAVLPPFGDGVDVGDFVKLAPGESFNVPASFNFPFHKRGRPPAGSLVEDGAYLVSVHVSVWPGTLDQAEKVRSRLGGLPISVQPVWSQPERIEIRSDSPVVFCGVE